MCGVATELAPCNERCAAAVPAQEQAQCGSKQVWEQAKAMAAVWVHPWWAGGSLKKLTLDGVNAAGAQTNLATLRLLPTSTTKVLVGRQVPSLA